MSAFGSSWPVFIGLTIVLVGGAGLLAGQAQARNWRPARHVLVASLLLGCADRFLVFALFDGELLTAAGFLLDTACILGLSWLAYRVTWARQMVTQYPWLYERAGVLGWRSRSRPIGGEC